MGKTERGKVRHRNVEVEFKLFLTHLLRVEGEKVDNTTNCFK